MLERIEQLDRETADALAAVSSPQELEQFRIKYLGSKGAVKNLMALLKDVPPADKPAFGKNANALRQKVEAAFNEKKGSLGGGQAAAGKSKASVIDVTEPGLPPRLGRTHVITQTIEELHEVFGRMGFDIATGPEIEDERHNFIALNIPEHHPARDPNDNFYVTDTELLRSQTSTIQIRVMETTKPPIRVIATGRVYRPDEIDATHHQQFHQVEGLYVDRGVTMVDLKSTLLQFAHTMFGPDAEVKLVPSYFPFTEPSAEMYVKMHVGGEFKWVELGGCGMVDHNVFEAVC